MVVLLNCFCLYEDETNLNGDIVINNNDHKKKLFGDAIVGIVIGYVLLERDSKGREL